MNRMPRFVWILLVLWCTALAQVSPVEPLLPQAEKECCGCHGQCGLPDCVLAPAPGLPPAETSGALTVSRPATPVTFLRLTLVTEKFFALFVPAVDVAVRPHAPPPAVPWPASAPLFQQHCSFLI